MLVLEARDRLGGRVETYRSKNDERFFVDLGASFVHGIYGNPITKLAAELKMVCVVCMGIIFTHVNGFLGTGYSRS